MRVYTIGLGLIGGSFCKAIKKHYPTASIFGIDASTSHLDEALSLGLIDEKSSLSEIHHADIIVVAVPVHAIVKILPKVLDYVSEETLVFDVGSTKLSIIASVKEHPNRSNYLAAHPIAGTEYSGPSAALADLYEGKTNIICEVEKTSFKLQERALALFQKMGMRIRYMDACSHDKHIAYMSHLSHISSFMLGKTVIQAQQSQKDIFDMAGSGFASTVRLAKSSPKMWTPILEQNKKNVLESLDLYIKNLNHFKNLMEQDLFEEVFQEMQQTNKIKGILDGIR